jgi:hypothetical protein
MTLGGSWRFLILGILKKASGNDNNIYLDVSYYIQFLFSRFLGTKYQLISDLNKN